LEEHLRRRVDELRREAAETRLVVEARRPARQIDRPVDAQ
jgi:hypothetical protein